ncbi:MAG: VIT domain-containing protein [Methanolobus sp.]
MWYHEVSWKKLSKGYGFISAVYGMCFDDGTFTREVVDSGVITGSYMNIDVDIRDGCIFASIEEKLDNNYDNPVTDTVQFLIPEDAFMSGFSLIIDGEEYKADILEKQEAPGEI